MQAFTTAAHKDEKTWSVEGHPAGEFWAERHFKTTTLRREEDRLVPEFEVAGERGSFIPFGESPLGVCGGEKGC